MKRFLAFLLSLTMVLSFMVVPSYADWTSDADKPTVTVSTTGVSGSNPSALVPGQKVKVSVALANVPMKWNAYQFELDYNDDLFELVTEESFGVDTFPSNNYTLLNAALGLPTINFETAGELIITGAATALNLSGMSSYMSSFGYDETTGTISFTAFTAEFTVKDGVDGDATFSLATTGDAAYGLGFSDTYSRVTGATGDVKSASVTVLKTNSLSVSGTPTGLTYGKTFADLKSQLTVAYVDGSGTVTSNFTGYKFYDAATEGNEVATTDGLTVGDSQTVYVGHPSNSSAERVVVTYSVGKADQAALTVTTTSATYGTDLTLTTSGGSGTGAVTYTVTPGTGTADVTGATLTPTQAGTVSVTATKAADDNYNEVSSTATTVTIAKADSTLVLSTPSSIAYGAAAPMPTASTNTSGETVTYTYSNSATGDFGAWSTSNGLGTYYVKGHTAETTNYNAADSEPKKFSVTAAAMPVGATATITGTATYGETLTAGTGGTFPSDATKAYQWYRGDAAISGATSNTYTLVTADVGSTITVKVSDSSGKYSGEVASTPTAAVAKKTASGTFGATYNVYFGDTAAKSVVIGDITGLPNDIANKAITNAAVTNKTDADSVIASALYNSFTLKSGLTSEKAGSEATWTVTVTSDNYADITATITVNVVNINIPWPEANTLTIEANPVYGDKNSDILKGFSTGEITATAATNVKGTYSVKDANEYPEAGTTKVTLLFTAKAGEPVQGTFEHDYTITAVAQKEVGLTWSGDTTRIYDGLASSVTATATGLVGTDSCTVNVTGGTETNAGTHTATAASLSDSNYKLPSANTKEYVINKVTLTPSIANVTAKEYDGTTTANGATIALVGAVNSESPTATATIAWTAATAGTTTVKATGIALGTDWTTNYVLSTTSISSQSAGNSVSITKKSVTPNLGTVSAQTFTGAQIKPTVTPTFGGETLAETTDYTISYGTNINAGTNAGSVTVSPVSTSNYTFTPATANFTIDKADAPNVTGIKFNVYYGDTTAKSYGAANFTTMPTDAGTVTVKSVSNINRGDVMTADPTTSGFALKSGLAAPGDVGKSASWTVTLESTNYADATATVTVTAVNVTFQVGNDAATNENSITVNESKLVYGSKWSQIVSKATNFTATVDGQSDTTQGNFKLYVDGAEMNGNTVPDVKGSAYTVKVLYSGTIDGKEYSNVEVASKDVTITKANHSDMSKTIYKSEVTDGQGTIDLELLGLTNLTGATVGTITKTDDTENKVLTLSGADDADFAFAADAKSGTATVTVEITDCKNYNNFTYTLTFNAGSRPSGGGGGGGAVAGKTITIGKTVNGTVTSDVKTAKEGDTVTLTVASNDGWTLETLTVTDKSGKEVSVKNLGNNKFSFAMPGSNVTVNATFMEDNTMLNFFVDVKAGDYYYNAVLWAAQNGITSGTDATHFSPFASCTRAQTVTFLWRAAGSPEPVSTVNPFTDVDTTAYYYKAVLWAIEQGITNGTSATTFSPEATVSRGQTVTFLYRAAKASASATENPFSDVAAQDYYYSAVLWAVEQGITEGVTATTFLPNADCIRGQIVTFLYRFYVK